MNFKKAHLSHILVYNWLVRAPAHRGLYLFSEILGVSPILIGVGLSAHTTQALVIGRYPLLSLTWLAHLAIV